MSGMNDVPATTAAISLLAAALSAACSGSASGSSSGRVTCSSFRCQGDAQAYYRNNPGSGLDGDGDGIACESLPRCVHLEPRQTELSTADFPLPAGGRWYFGDAQGQHLDVLLYGEQFSCGERVVGEVHSGGEIGDVTGAFIERPALVLEVTPRGEGLEPFELAIIEGEERLVGVLQGRFAGLSDTDIEVLHVIDG